MTDPFPRMAFPNESPEYRQARNALLDAEIALRRQTEAVAQMRRALPPGGEVPEDFVFERIGAHQRPEPVRLSSLFGEHRSILIYSYMFGPERDVPCPGCTHLATASTAPRGMCRSARRFMSSPPRRSPGWQRGRIVAGGTTFSSCRPRATATTRITTALPPR